MSTEKKGLFYQNWNKTEEEFSAEEMDLKINELKRMFEIDYDKATDQIIANKRKLKDLFKDNFKKFTPNDYRLISSEINDIETGQKDVAKRYEEFFGEKITR